MPDRGQGVKRPLQTHPADLLALALPEVEYLDAVLVTLTTEPQLMLDVLVRMRYHGAEYAVDLEIEAHRYRYARSFMK
jgi:hypothetical protein